MFAFTLIVQINKSAMLFADSLPIKGLHAQDESVWYA